MVAEPVAEHWFKSLTVTVYVPGVKFTSEEELPPVFQEYEKGPFPEANTLALPLAAALQLTLFELMLTVGEG